MTAIRNVEKLAEALKKHDHVIGPGRWSRAFSQGWMHVERGTAKTTASPYSDAETESAYYTGRDAANRAGVASSAAEPIDGFTAERRREQRRFELAKAASGGFAANPRGPELPDEIARLSVLVADAVLAFLESDEKDRSASK